MCVFLLLSGPQRDALTRDQLAEHRIEEQSERAIKLLEPYTRQLVNPRANISKSTLGAPKVAGPKTAGRKRATANVNEQHPKLHLRYSDFFVANFSQIAT